MRRRWLRLILVLGFVAAAGGAGYLAWMFQSREAATRAALAAYEAQAERATRALAELRATLEAYVAAGQQTGFWAPKVQTALDVYAEAAAELARLTPGSTADLVPTEDLAQLDLRARQLVENDQSLVASDLLFTDGLEMIRGAVDRVDEARLAARAGSTATMAEVDRQMLYTAGATLAAALLVILLLAPAGQRTTEGAETHLNVATPPDPPADLDLALGANVDARLGETQDGGKGDAVATAAAGPSVDIAAAADLCSDLGRLADASTLPALLERAAGLLGAKGLTIWIADPTERLHPAAAHGYSPQALSRLGSLDPSGDNAAAAAYRTSSAQTVAGDASHGGAVVVPLVGVGGCVGVLAAEMEPGREHTDGVRDLARIVAAQLATLMPAATEARAAEPPAARAESG